MISYDPKDEVRYRKELSEGFLREAERAFQLSDWRGTVANSQLASENAAKALIAIFRIPSWSHDPSDELLDIRCNMPEELQGMVEELADIVRELAPEHGRTTYGEPALGLTPWDLYSKEDAERALGLARKAVVIMREVLKDMLHL